MKNQVRRPNYAQSGSMLVWIFIFIGLFAALSFAMTQGLRGNATALTDQQAKIAVSDIMEYLTQVRNAVKAMRIDGIPINQIDFDTDTTVAQDGSPFPQDNTNCATDACEIFNPLGGGLRSRQFHEYAGEVPSGWGASWAHVGSVIPMIAEIQGVGTILPEVLLQIPIVDPTLCKTINKQMGITIWPVEEDMAGKTYHNFAGNVDPKLAANDAWTFGDDEPELIGKTAFCMGDDTQGDIFLMIEAR